MSNVKIHDAGELFPLTDVILLSDHNKALFDKEKLISKQAKRIKELEATISILETTQKWISVNDRLPEEETEVIFIQSNGQIHIGDFWKSGEILYWYGRAEPRARNVTHWMPFPPPPKTEEK